jgi:chromate reductase
MRILAISGSLRARSSNTAVLMAAARLAPPGQEIVLFEGLGDLPYFNADLDTDDPPAPVRVFRQHIGACQGLLLCSPEYARGVSGVMKNALDWLVGSTEFPDKPVALINTSERAVHADAHLRLTLTTMSARLVESASITLPLLGLGLDVNGIVSNSVLAAQLRVALDCFARTIAGRQP